MEKSGIRLVKVTFKRRTSLKERLKLWQHLGCDAYGNSSVSYPFFDLSEQEAAAERWAADPRSGLSSVRVH